MHLNGKIKERSIDYNVPDEFDSALACLLDAEWYQANPSVIFPEMFTVGNINKHLCAIITNFYKLHNRPPTYSELLREANRIDENDKVMELIAQKLEGIYGLHSSDAIKVWKAEQVYQLSMRETHRLVGHRILNDLNANVDLASTRRLIQDFMKLDSAGKLTWHTGFEALEDEEPANWIITDLVDAGDLFGLYGESGVGKTWLMLSLIVHVAIGKKFLNLDCQPAQIFWIDQENRERRFKRRLKAVIKYASQAYGIDAHSIANKIHYVCSPKPAIAANHAESINQIQHYLNQFEGNKLVVFDNLGSISDVKSMNDSNMQAVMQGLHDLCNDTTAVAILHHKPKRDDATMYGSMYIKANLDSSIEMLSLAGKQYKDSSGEECTYGEHVCMLRRDKSRDEEFSSVVVELIIDDWIERVAVNPRFVLLENALIEKTKLSLRKNKLSKYAEAMTYLREHPDLPLGKSKHAAAKDLAELTGIYRDAWRKVIDNLIAQGFYVLEAKNARDPNSKLEKGEHYVA